MGLMAFDKEKPRVVQGGLPSGPDDGTAKPAQTPEKGPLVRRVHIPSDGGQVDLRAPEDDSTLSSEDRASQPDVYNPLQSVVLGWREEFLGMPAQNLVLCSPTGSGKTLAAEIATRKVLKRGEGVIYVAPLRLLAQEKKEQWTKPGHPWAWWATSIITGDYRLTDKRKAELAAADIIVMTSEMLASRTRRMEQEGNTWLRDRIGALIVDEAHLLTYDGRGDHLEAALVNFTAVNPAAPLVFLSATMANGKDIAGWVSKLNGLDTFVVDSDYRPTELGIHMVAYPEPPGESYYTKEDRKLKAFLETIRDFPDDQILAFVHSKAFGKKAFEALRSDNESVAWLSADLDLDDRVAVRDSFNDAETRVVVSTSVVAQGMDLPARRTVIGGVHRGMSEVDPIDVIQMCGRAGHSAYAARGDAHVVVGEHDARRWDKLVRTPPTIRSTLTRPAEVAFHLISEIDTERVRTVNEALAWLSRTLAHHQTQPWDKTAVESVFAELADWGLIQQLHEDDEDDHRWRAMWPGKVASWLYFDPYDVARWSRNWRRVFDGGHERDEAAIAWAACNLGPHPGWYMSKHDDWGSKVGEFLDALGACGLKIKGETQLVGATMLWLHLCGRKHTRGKVLLRGITLDADRWVQAWRLLDSKTDEGGSPGESYWETTALRIKYGVGLEAAMLCRLKGIGRVRAESLLDAGIRSFRDFVRQRDDAMRRIGSKAYGVAFYDLRTKFRTGEIEIPKER